MLQVIYIFIAVFSQDFSSISATVAGIAVKINGLILWQQQQSATKIKGIIVQLTCISNMAVVKFGFGANIEQNAFIGSNKLVKFFGIYFFDVLVLGTG